MSTSQSILEMLSPYPPGWGGVLLKGALSTISISLGAYLLGMLIGLGGALGKLKGNPPVLLLLDVYTTAVRAIPELILIIGLYYAGTDGLNRILSSFGLPNVEINGFVAAIAVLGIVQGAYMTEVFRGAILAIPVGQIEAASSFGMRPWLRFRRIALPALIPNALPGLANLWMSVTKDSALIAVVGYQELALATRIAAGNTKHYFLFFLVAAAVYLVITLVSNVVFGLLESRYRRGQPKTA
ncbi:ABC transporter permease subunit [Mesorhizobium sp. M1A.F.Ca.IN.022.07.1.1]|uniref:ABC transporter permease n=1 Tax=unclassified Mesorhizobium TaxID=325217 RepID=UPI0007FDD605|nr:MULTISPECIES: ABC transporter permease subunit [unclassified Mesorhizobium]TGV91860.1 ABC transporter permease subunit [Mesorhizobium sp. M00.F.Ca.ET.158.01.1.1]WIE90494.1 ABC transporter permease subunit [Mesorhizobium sp. WSM4875]AZO58713.1 ABC transporter permease subunit [Mesorhizobium sp. M1A.F.Ca.IN.022.06.1.1]MCT2578819.1 ABC transporter permease subunit [Mesorhizobium sp. P13.3]MDF3167758.1 ABC transporter permease subunit [Mesorhizobium sp. P16.1]